MTNAETGLNKELLWWQKTIAYEIYVNSFMDSDGDGYGDINGIRSKLSYLQELKVGAIWLTPVYASPMVDNGYDVSDYYSINPLYGTMEDMEALIAEAGEKGIGVVMDLVVNHTSDKCEWFINSSKGKDNRYSDWYIWRDAKPDGSAPNNWRSIFGGSAWTWSEERGQYYLHTFAPEQPDLNWEIPEVRQAVCDIANFWLGKGVGGFRMDAIPYIKKPYGLPDGPADAPDGLVSVHDMTVNTDGILDFLKEFKQKVTAGKDIFTVGEANGVGPDDLKYWIGDNGVFDMIFEFSHVNMEFTGAEVWCQAREWTLKDLKRALTASQTATASNGWYPVFFENHDKPRSPGHYFGDADPVLASKALAAVLLTLRGTPFIYQGEELGMTNVRWDSIDDYNDIDSRSQYDTALDHGFEAKDAMEFVYRFSRDNARTPMQWDGSDNAGFTSGRPWLPVNDDHVNVNAQDEMQDGRSVLAWYKTLAALRTENHVLTHGDYREVMEDSDSIFAFVRSDENDKLVTLVNFSGTDQVCDIEVEEILLSSYQDGGSIPGRLRPYEAVIARLP